MQPIKTSLIRAGCQVGSLTCCISGSANKVFFLWAAIKRGIRGSAHPRSWRYRKLFFVISQIDVTKFFDVRATCPAVYKVHACIKY